MAKKDNKNKLENPSVLAFEAKLVLSDAMMKSGNWEDRDNSSKWKAVKVEEIRARGTISNRMSKDILEDASKLEQKVEEESKKPNPLLYDKASLPFEDDTLKVNFTLRILGNIGKPTACNIAEYEEKLSKVVSQYSETYGFKELAKRYAHNIANGRFLWRNRVSAESVEIRVKVDEEVLLFDAYEIGMRDFNKSNKSLDKLAMAIEEGLSDSTEEKFTFIEVEAFSKMGKGQQVYPSQKMNMETKKGEKSKFLFKLNEGKANETAGMHSQKIGNALRTIDDWHSKADSVGAIAIEPYGSVTSRGMAYRTGNDNFYKLLDNWILKDKEPNEEEQHYVMAVLVRGGVFSESKEKK
jgi:CRISPR-associated protein Csy3